MANINIFRAGCRLRHQQNLGLNKCQHTQRQKSIKDRHQHIQGLVVSDKLQHTDDNYQHTDVKHPLTQRIVEHIKEQYSLSRGPTYSVDSGGIHQPLTQSETNPQHYLMPVLEGANISQELIFVTHKHTQRLLVDVCRQHTQRLVVWISTMPPKADVDSTN